MAQPIVGDRRGDGRLGVVWRRLLSGCAIACIAGGCGDPPAGPGGRGPILSSALISEPIVRNAFDAGPASGGLAYVSMSPETDSVGASIAIYNRRLGVQTGTLMSAGGFDPIHILADAGDTLILRVHHFAGDSSISYLTVPPRAPPAIVRTSPRNRKTDVPLNADVVVIFTEPMLGSTLSGAVHLFHGDSEVVARLTPIIQLGDTLGIRLTPADSLAPATTYELRVSATAQAVDGALLPSPIVVTFTTTTTSSAPPCLQDCWALEASPLDYTFSDPQGAGAVNGVLYYVSGLSVPGGMPLHAYDAASNSWSARASLPSGRWDGAVGVVNGIVYAIGGDDTTRTTARTHSIASVAAYDPVTDRWAARSPMPTPRWGLGVGVVNGILYAVGGIDSNFVALATVEAYDPAANSWSTRASLPVARSSMGVGVVNGVLYVVGGQVGFDSQSRRVDAYDPATNRWTTMAPLPTGRHALGVAGLDGLLYAVGGQDASGNALTIVEAYDPRSDSWTLKGPLRSKEGPVAVAVVNGVLYAAGVTTQAYHP